jgi:hypothetical protein
VNDSEKVLCYATRHSPRTTPYDEGSLRQAARASLRRTRALLVDFVRDMTIAGVYGC